jgi:aryl-alcohol dehydrogenase-like predicted oxidoreductase
VCPVPDLRPGWCHGFVPGRDDRTAIRDFTSVLLPWSPLAGGWLTGKYRRDESPTGESRLGEDPERGMEEYAPRNASERKWDVIAAVGKIAESRGVSMAQVALAWTADRPAVTSVILGARTVAQLDDNFAAADLHLSADETALLDEVSDPIVGEYPYGP